MLRQPLSPRAMLNFITRRVLVLLATMLAVSFVVFAALELNSEDVATHVLGQFATPDQRHLWLSENGYYDPFPLPLFALARPFRGGRLGPVHPFQGRGDHADTLLPQEHRDPR